MIGMEASWKSFRKTAQTWGYFAPSHDAPSAQSWQSQSVPAAERAVSAVSSGVRAPFGWLRLLGKRISKDLIRPAQADVSRIGRQLGAAIVP